MTQNATLIAGLEASQNPIPQVPNLALTLTDGDLSAAASNMESCETQYANLMSGIDRDTAREETNLRSTLERALSDRNEIEQAVTKGVTAFQKNQLQAKADEFRKQVINARQWAERAQVSLAVMSSPAALLTARHGLDSSQEYANLVERTKVLGFAGFQAAAAQCLNQRDMRLGAALVEVLQNKTKREMAAAAGVTINSIAEHLIGEAFRQRKAALLKIVDGAKLLEEAWASQYAFMTGKASSPNLSPRAKIEHGTRLAEIQKLTKTTAKAS